MMQAIETFKSDNLKRFLTHLEKIDERTEIWEAPLRDCHINEKKHLVVGNVAGSDVVDISTTAWEQIRMLSRMSTGYFSRLEKRNEELWRENINFALKDSGQDADLRVVAVKGKDILQGIAPSNDKNWSHERWIEEVEEAWKAPADGEKFTKPYHRSYVLSDAGMRLQIIADGGVALRKDDRLHDGIQLDTSEIGLFPTRVGPLVWRLACTNGMIRLSLGRQYRRNTTLEQKVVRGQLQEVIGNMAVNGTTGIDGVKRLYATKLAVLTDEGPMACGQVPDAVREALPLIRCPGTYRAGLIEVWAASNQRHLGGLWNALTLLAQGQDLPAGLKLQEAASRLQGLSDRRLGRIATARPVA